MLYLVLDNIRSILNVGAIFRTADAAGVQKIFLCGITAYPGQKEIRQTDNLDVDPTLIKEDGSLEINYAPSHECVKSFLEKRIAKTALKALGQVEWEHRININELISEIREAGFEVIALEQSPRSIDYRKIKIGKDVALIVGNEVSGIGESTLKLCDQIIEIPMHGVGKSLNVATSAGIALYKLIEKVS